MPALTPLQLKLARTALGLGVRELASKAGVSPTTVTRFESGKAGVHSSTLERFQTVLETGGVIFIPADASGGPGVRLRSSGS
jgi:transcriptional regulator with XRE-family HTH domain